MKYILLLLLSFTFCARRGIDVSAWQGNINWGAVKAAGIEFAIIRAGTGNGNKDKYFEQNYAGAHAQGIQVGTYWYSYAGSGAAAAQEAQHNLNIIRGRKFEFPIYVDIEEKSIFSKGIANQIAQNFCGVMESNRFFCGIYSSKSYYDSYFSAEVKKKYSIWVAQWSSRCTYSGPYGVWQYTSSGSVSGISGRVDMDYAYIDFLSIMKQAHLNGY